jgi:hypothetical protein
MRIKLIDCIWELAKKHKFDLKKKKKKTFNETTFIEISKLCKHDEKCCGDKREGGLNCTFVNFQQS